VVHGQIVVVVLSVIKEPERPETCLAVEAVRELHAGWTSATDLVDYQLDSGVGAEPAPIVPTSTPGSRSRLIISPRLFPNDSHPQGENE
jgi:hypothetical protein